jgi:hypothetical protein
VGAHAKVLRLQHSVDSVQSDLRDLKQTFKYNQQRSMQPRRKTAPLAQKKTQYRTEPPYNNSQQQSRPVTLQQFLSQRLQTKADNLDRNYNSWQTIRNKTRQTPHNLPGVPTA